MVDDDAGRRPATRRSLPASRRLRAGALLCGIAALGLGTWWRLARAPAGPRLVILYAPCTLNRNVLSPYDAAIPFTPALDRFARAGTVFTHHHTESGQSGIAYASLLSGNQAPRHGVYYHPTRLSDDLYLIGEAFRDAGYQTFYWANQPMASPELNYGQGVDPGNTFSSQNLSLPFYNEYFLRAQDVRFRLLLRVLQADPRARALVIGAFTVTHAPYFHAAIGYFCADYPQECEGQFPSPEFDRYLQLYWDNFLQLQFDYEATLARLGLSPEEGERLAAVLRLVYRSNVYFLDRRFGELLDAIDAAGLADQTLIVFTADHGEQLERRLADMRWTHGFALTAEDVVVPLIVRGPGVRAGRVDAVTRSIDVFPTMAGLAGVSLPAQAVEGTDLSPVLRGETAAPAQLAFMHTSLLPDGFAPDTHAAIFKRFPRRDPDLMWTAVRDGDLVYKLSGDGDGRFALHVYDWAADPGETTDLADPDDPVQAAMLKHLGAYKGALVEAYSYWQAVAEGRVPDERQRELMRSLGYIE